MTDKNRTREQLVKENEVAELRRRIAALEHSEAERKRAEAALRKARHQLERCVEERTAELVNRNKQLELEISERKRAEEALREGEERYRRITEAVTDYVFTVRIKDGYPAETIHGPTCVAVTGYTPEEFDSDPYLWIRIVHEEDRSVVRELVRRLLSGQDVQPIEHRILRKEGVVRWVKNTTVPHHDSEGKLQSYDGLIRDIHERKQVEEAKAKLEAQFHQAQKMEAVGTLAGGIAHDFNNLLTVVLGNAQLMISTGLNPTHPHYELVKEIENRAKLGAHLTSQLLGFAMGGKYEVKPFDINAAVRESSNAFGRTRKEITIHQKLQKDLPPIEADIGQIEQVLMNLYVNAAHAMPDGGTLYLETRNITLKDIQNKPFRIEPGSYMLLSVTDTGVGMDKETQERIFDPFFTTKEMGRGTGLGLASVYGIIKAHKGYIEVESEKDHGTTFKIYLPISKREVAKSVRLAQDFIKGTETILFVDDEEPVLSVGARALNMLGYTVLKARSGHEAVEIYKTDKDKIDLVILDMIMPDIGGGKVYDLLKAIDPDIKCLLCSGYSINGQATEILERGCDGFIQKPFDLKKLSEKIRGILEKE